MLTAAETTEAKALAANDIRVIVGQLNNAIKRGAEHSLKIQIEVSSVIDIKGAATCYPILSARVLAEIE
jgi:hypothetical protein